MMLDIDVPSRARPVHSQKLHWLVVNIPGSNVKEGDHKVEYVGSAPGEGTGSHRFVFLVFEQKYKQNFDHLKFIDKFNVKGRLNFDARYLIKFVYM